MKEPLFWRWTMGCWHKPIWIGLPLLLIAVILVYVDLTCLILHLTLHWGEGKRAERCS